MCALKLYDQYDRREAHDALSPGTPFYEQAGQWGMNGVVRISKGANNFVFFVKLDGSSYYSAFQSISKEGILKWLPPQNMGPDSPLIKTLISHDYRKNAIHLFVKTKKTKKFVYLGPVVYKSYRVTRNSVLLFEWKILTWSLTKNLASLLDLD